MKNLKAALIQMNSNSDQEQNMQKMFSYLREAASNGAGLVVFPENSIYIGSDIAEHAISIENSLIHEFSDAARSNHIWLHIGSIPESIPDNRKPANTSLFFSPDGRMIASYRKIHLFDVNIENINGYRESDSITPGNTISCVDTEFGKVGMSICYDIRFPQLYRTMARKGAEVMLIAANFTAQTGAAHWKPLLQARAIENTCFVLACDQCGKNSSFESYGHSMIIDPWGKILAEAGTEEEIIYANLEADLLIESRKSMPSLQNDCDEVYN